MIISHKHKFIFIAIPKTGTHAIRFALREHMGNEDEEQVGLFVQKKLKNKRIAEIGHGHISCLQAKEVLSEKIWNSYFKFAFVRNPWDRYISFCAFMHRNNPKFHKTPELFLRRMIEKTQIQQRVLFRPQVEFICDEQNHVMLDYVGRYENFQENYDNICEKIGITTQQLDQLNTSKHLYYKEYYNEELVKKVANFYQQDISILQYNF